jgi:hypothetical protein
MPISRPFLSKCPFVLLVMLVIPAQLWAQRAGAPVQRASVSEVSVPETDGRPVMIDGLFTTGEWDDAFAREAGEGVTLYLKQEKGHVFIGIRCGGLGTSVVDLFIQPTGNEIHQLHASAQIGEIVLSGPGEEDPRFAWGYSPEWTANEVRWDQGRREVLVAQGMDQGQAQVETIFPYDGFEFQIRKRKFDSSRWLIRFSVYSAQARLSFPPGTESKDTEGWLLLDLGSETGMR